MEKDTKPLNQTTYRETVSKEYTNQNVVSSELIKKEYNLPEGYSWDAQFENGKIKDGIVTIYDEDGCLFKRMEYRNGLLNGVCEYFDSGEIIGKRVFEDGVEEGWGCEIQMGHEIKWLSYENGRLVMELVESVEMENYWDGILVDSQERVSCCQYDENHKAFGKGYLYENGRISKIVMFENGEIVRVLKEFQGDVMTEYDENNVKVYVGGFDDSIDYPREGEGKEYENGVIVYKGHWKADMRDGHGKSIKDGEAEYIGNWGNNKPHGEGVVMQKRRILREGEWKWGRLVRIDTEQFDFHSSVQQQLEIYSENGLKQVMADGKQIVEEITIMGGLGETICTDLDINGFAKLKSISIQDETLGCFISLRIRNNPVLEFVECDYHHDFYYSEREIRKRGTLSLESALSC